MSADPEHGPIQQLRVAARHPLAALLGAAVGGVVPLATYKEAHQEALLRDPYNLKWALVCGGLLFSAKTVWQWGAIAFSGDRWKATGYVLLLEGVMVFSSFEWLSQTALGFLIGINAIATGCRFALRDQADCARSPSASSPSPDDLKRAALLASEEMLPALCVETSASQPTEAADEARVLEAAAGRTDSARNPDGELYDRALQLVLERETCSISALQRGLSVGYNKAALLVERLEREGVVGPAPGRAGVARQVLLELPDSAGGTRSRRIAELAAVPG